MLVRLLIFIGIFMPIANGCAPGQEASSGFNSSTPNFRFQFLWTSFNDSQQSNNYIARGKNIVQSSSDMLSDAIKLKSDVSVQVIQCNGLNDHYSYGQKKIQLCNERLQQFYHVSQKYKTQSQSFEDNYASMIKFYFFHEAGHALIHQLKLDYIGKEEDAVDQFASLILTSTTSTNAVVDASFQFLETYRNGHFKQDYSSEHSLAPQRYFNLLCWGYGDGGSQQFDEHPAFALLPEARKQKCRMETPRNRRSWEKLLSPHLRSRSFIRNPAS